MGGMAKALRTIPVILGIARHMQELAPGALLVNFTNPAGLVTEALARYMPEVPAVGVCNVPITAKMRMLELYERRTGKRVDAAAAELDTLGLNHLSWHRGLRYEGEDLWPEVFAGTLDELRAAEKPEWDPRLLEVLGMIPNYYLQYFYNTAHKLAEQDQWPPSRAEQVMAIEGDLLREYGDPNRSEPPADLMKRGGAYYSTLATQLLNAHYNDLREQHVVNTVHGGAVAGWPVDWVLEMPVDGGARRDASRSRPRRCPRRALAWSPPSSRTKFSPRRPRSRATATRCSRRCWCTRSGPEADQVQAVMDDLLEINRQFLPQFWSAS